jgi:hypothetical protein
MPSECRFRDDGTKATWFYKPDDGDDRMKENDEDVVHAGIVSKSQKIPEFRPILEFATDTLRLTNSIHRIKNGVNGRMWMSLGLRFTSRSGSSTPGRL